MSHPGRPMVRADRSVVNGASMDNATLYGRRLLSGGTLSILFAASLALMAIFAYAPGGTPSTTPVAVLASVGLVDDDGHQGLFNVTGLVPGRATSRCVQVQYGGPAPAGTVFFSASDITGPLAASLKLKVEQGTGGNFASCHGFTGAVVYDGALTGLVDADPAEPHTTTGWSPSAGDERTYRLTATMRDNVSVQGQASTATFRWFLFGGPSPTPAATATATPATTPTPTPTATPTTAPAVVEVDPTIAVVATASAAVVPTSAAPTAVRSAAVPAAVQPSRVSPSATVAAAPPVAAKKDTSPVAQVRQALADLGRNITEVAVRTSTHSALPVTGLAVLLAFLTVQNRIDRMDPKLAMAPAKDPHLHFHEPDSEPDTDPRTDEPEHAPPDADEAAP
jgi:hypothetical protein